MATFVIKAKTGEYWQPKEALFVHRSQGHRYRSMATAQKSLNALLAKNPILAALNPQILTVVPIN